MLVPDRNVSTLDADAQRFLGLVGFGTKWKDREAIVRLLLKHLGWNVAIQKELELIVRLLEKSSPDSDAKTVNYAQEKIASIRAAEESIELFWRMGAVPQVKFEG